MATNSLSPNSLFSIKHPGNSIIFNRAPPSQVSRIIQYNLGATGTIIPASALVGGYVFVSPGTGAQTYTLPSATQILSEFGEPLGAANINAGDVLSFYIVNKGTFNCLIASQTGTGGGDGTIIVANAANATGSFSTGAISPIGHSTFVKLEFTSVSNGGVIGSNNIGIITQSTGSYSVYN